MNDEAGRWKQKDILILTSPTGAGHDSVAAALQEAIHALAPGVRVRILDPLSGKRSDGPLSPGRWYDAAVAHAPWLWGLCYHATDNARAVRLGMAAGALLWARRLRSAIETERPGAVVAVHPLCTRLAAEVLRTVAAPPSLHCVVTDLVTIHRCWAADGVDSFHVATPDAWNALVAMGIPPDHIRLTGLPLRACFARTPHTMAEDAIPRVLLLGGGHPSRRIEKIAHALITSHQPLRLIVVCGRNARLRRRLTRAVGARATVLGWCDDIAALMRWSSVVITKGGTTTLAEALSQARLVLIYQVLPGQEVGNVALVTRTDAGCYIPNAQALVQGISLHKQPAVSAAHAAWWGGAAQRVAACILTAAASSVASHRSAHIFMA